MGVAYLIVPLPSACREMNSLQTLAALDHKLTKTHKVVQLVSSTDVWVVKLHPLHIPIQTASKNGSIAVATPTLRDVDGVYTLLGSCEVYDSTARRSTAVHRTHALAAFPVPSNGTAYFLYL